MTDQQHEADIERASNQNRFADIARNVEHSHGDGFFTGLVTGAVRAVVGSTAPGKAVFASTDFGAKNLDLNEMVDLVDQTNPEDLESSGKALSDARKAIKAAADELRGRIDRVQWKGQAGNEFREYGRALVKSTDELSEYAGKAGDQVLAAAVGLASVRSAMPARDPRNLKRPENFSEGEKTEKKDEYDAAVKVEKDRQEAINQMNRLASYYAVSSQQLSVLQEKPPTFPPMPNVGVPPAPLMSGSAAGDSGTASAARTAGAGHYAPPAEATGQAGAQAVNDAPARVTPAQGTIELPDDAVGTTIDSVGTLPAATTTPAPGSTPPVTGTPPTAGGQPGHFDSYVPLVPGKGSGKATGGAGGLRTPVSAQGRPQQGLTNSVTGRPTGPGATHQTGRPTATGQATGRGGGSTARPFPMGQSGVTGGTPRPGGTAGARPNVGPATGAGRANGVVGGRPASPPGAGAKGGAKIPRGTVIGTGPVTNAQPSAGTGQRGVIGAPPAGARPGTGASGASRGGVGGSAQPVTGRPTGRNSATKSERNGMTRGGAGLVRRSDDRGNPDGERETQASSRPDYVVEDPETHLPEHPRRNVPPVVN
ncbi:hypothetical protein [Streptomyces sp. JB150]|uniref:hypothetical protein n=1 Tax=Streptomyces sp. JB150 TaxID=2714844 RepID=UPI00140C661D|nr:hypothetical protein [Streptomyces sp. JB150]QIJ65065.1 hypothetical protein G7Z13_25810 [Streptomyces sp. JB150]